MTLHKQMGPWIIPAAAVLVSPVSPLAQSAYGAAGDQLHRLFAADAENFDGLGSSAAIDGDFAVLGARGGEFLGASNIGAAYLYDTTTGNQAAKLTPSDGDTFDSFGRSVSISGDRVLVGSPFNDSDATGAGAAYLYNTSPGNQLDRLAPDDFESLDNFGWAVAIDGDIAVITSRHEDESAADAGAAYVFDVSTGQQLHKLLPDDGQEDDFFGWSAAISGNTAIISATGDDDNGTTSGSAYLFNIATGQQLHKLLPDDGAAGDEFGRSVGISGNVAIVGSPFDSVSGTGSGSAYLFDATTGQQITKLTPDDGEALDRFGISVGISGDVAVVGANLDDANETDSGSAYLFDVTTGDQVVKLLPDAAAREDQFGIAVAVSGQTAVVGAWEAEPPGFFESGMGYLFDATISEVVNGDANGDGKVDAADLNLLALPGNSRCRTGPGRTLTSTASSKPVI